MQKGWGVPFSRTPRGFEADLSEGKQDELRAFQPNPSWV